MNTNGTMAQMEERAMQLVGELQMMGWDLDELEGMSAEDIIETYNAACDREVERDEQWQREYGWTL